MKKLSNSIMLILLIAAIFFFYEEMKPIQIDAVELAKAYNTNKIEADKKYLNKVIEVRGIVRTYYQLTNGINFLELKTDSSTVNFYCFFMNKQDENTASKLNQQDTIIVSGKCVGMDKYKFIEGLKVEVKKIVE